MPRTRTRYPGIETLTDGRKRIRLRAVNPKSGRMEEVDKIVQTTVEDAVKLREQWRDEIRFADRKSVEIPRLADYAESWMRSRALGCKRSTATWYAYRLDRHILPVLGAYFIDKITHDDVRAWQADLAQKMAPRSVNGGLAVLKMVLGDAMAEYGLSRSPAERVKALPMRKVDEDPNILDAAELAQVLTAFHEETPQHHPLVMTLALTGLRFGEASALRWEDIDEGRGSIRVVRAQWRGIVSTPKTGKVRTVPLVPELASVLRAHRERLLARQAPGLDQGWVFPSREGGVHAKEVLRKPLAKVLAKVKIGRRFTTHGFRRTFNNLTRQVAGEIVTRSITGHVTASMTEHYSHVGAGEKQAAAGRVFQMVFGAASGGSGGGSK